MSNIFVSEIVRKDRLLPGIHGLRGLAALAVVLYHLHHLTGIVTPEFFKFIGRDFGYSVHLFFIVSAFSLYYSEEYKTNKEYWIRDYFIKRFFRIAPLFYFVIFLELIRQIVFSGKISTSLNNILLNLTFSFGSVPFSGMVWGGWSVGVEMIFYIVFPLLFLVIRTHRRAFIFLFLSLIISYLVRSELNVQYLTLVPKPKWDWSYFAFTPNLCFFLMGIYAYQLGEYFKYSYAQNKLLIYTLGSVCLIIIFGLTFTNFGKYLYGAGRLDITLWGFGFMLLVIWQYIKPSFVIANSFFQYLGERSFSIYLLHPIVLFYFKAKIIAIYDYLFYFMGPYAFFFCAIIVLCLILILSEFTYRFIEILGIRIGKKYQKFLIKDKE